MQVEYTADSLYLPLLRFSKEDRDLMSTVGDVAYECTAAKPAKPVAITSSDSYMVRETSTSRIPLSSISVLIAVSFILSHITIPIYHICVT